VIEEQRIARQEVRIQKTENRGQKKNPNIETLSPKQIRNSNQLNPK
jgi:hypothetical protein